MRQPMEPSSSNVVSYEVPLTKSGADALEEALSRFFSMVFGWMFLGLLITGVVSFLMLQKPFINLLAILVYNPLLLLGLFILEIILVIAITGTASSTSMPLPLSLSLFLIYSALNGITLSPIFLIYTKTSIAFTFLVTSIMFAGLSVLGYITKAPAKWGTILMAGLIALIIGEVVNLFLRLPGMYHVLTILGIIIFMGLTMYDVSKLKRIAERHIELVGPSAVSSRALMGAAVQGALSLYLDFINLFLYLLRLLGRRR